MPTFKTLNLEKYKEKTDVDDFVDKIDSYEKFIYDEIFKKFKNTCSIEIKDDYEVKWSCKEENGERGIKFPCNTSEISPVACKDVNDKIGFEKFRNNIKKCNKEFVIIPVGLEFESVKCSVFFSVLGKMGLTLLREKGTSIKKNLDLLINKKSSIKKNIENDIENKMKLEVNEYLKALKDFKFGDFVDLLDEIEDEKAKEILRELLDEISTHWQKIANMDKNKDTITNMHKNESLYLSSSEEFKDIINEIIIGHRNIVVYNVQKKEYFRIEPNGSDVDNNWYEIEKFDIEFKKYMKMIDTDIKAIKLTDSCPLSGPQFITQDDYCILWSFFILEHILLNPTIDVKTVQKEIMKKYHTKLNLTSIISKYLSYIEDYIEDYKKNIDKTKFSVASLYKTTQDPKLGGKRKKRRKKIKSRTMRKHSGINQSTGRLRKGYRYPGKKLKSGLPQIIKIKKKKLKDSD